MQEQLLATLYEKYQHTAYVYVLGLCGKKELAEDIVSEGFLRALESLPDEKEMYFLWWLLRVCKNVWLDFCRKQKKIADFAPEDYASQADVWESVLQRDTQKKLYDALRALPPKAQQILLWYYYAQLPIQEIAVLQGISAGAAKTALFRARRRLKQQLAQQEVEQHDL